MAEACLCELGHAERCERVGQGMAAAGLLCQSSQVRVSAGLLEPREAQRRQRAERPCGVQGRPMTLRLLA